MYLALSLYHSAHCASSFTNSGNLFLLLPHIFNQLSSGSSCNQYFSQPAAQYLLTDMRHSVLVSWSACNIHPPHFILNGSIPIKDSARLFYWSFSHHPSCSMCVRVRKNCFNYIVSLQQPLILEKR